MKTASIQLRCFALIFWFFCSGSGMATSKPGSGITIDFEPQSIKLDSNARAQLEKIIEWTKKENLCPPSLDISVDLEDSEASDSQYVAIMAKRIILVRTYLEHRGLGIAAASGTSFRFFRKLGKAKTFDHRIHVDVHAWFRRPNGICY